MQVRVYATKYPGHGRRLAEKAARGGADLIGAIGGDGTLNEVVDGVMRAGVYGPDGLPKATITILPLGTASDFHRSMAWEPNDFEEAMWRIGKRGSSAVLDVAQVRCASPDGPKERYFINVASCGVSARAAMKVHSWQWLGQKAAYRMAALTALMSHVPRNLAVRVDGGEWKKIPAATLVAIGNGSYFGNGLNICPNANPYDGSLQVVTAQKMRVWDFIFSRHRLKMGKHLDMKGVGSEEGRQVDVAIWDGKSKGPKDKNTWEVLEGYGSDSSPGGTTPESGSFTTTTTNTNTITMNGVQQPSQQQQQQQQQQVLPPEKIPSREWSGSERSNSTFSSFPRSPSGGSRDDLLRSPSKRAAEREARHKPSDYGAMPVEVDGEVIGYAPFSVTIIPGAIKFRV